MKKTTFIINTIANSGSTGRIAEEIGQLAAANGFDCYMAYGRTNNHSQLNTIRIGNGWDCKVHALETRLFDNHGFASKQATRKFIRELEQINPDIIHLHNIHGYYINVEYLFDYLRNTGVPVVWTLHDCWPMTGHCSYFDFVNCDKWKTFCCKCPNKKKYPSSYLLDRSKKNFLKKRKLFTSVKNISFVTPSYWLERVVKQSFFNSYSVKVIHNGVDLTVFRPVVDESVRIKYGLKPEEKIILGVASTWDRRKGLADFMKLHDLLGKKERIVLVGLNDGQIRNLPENVIGIKRTENVKELASLYSIADVFVNPTYVDNFPTTNIEALACGTPVVTYKTGGSPEAVDEATGRVVDKGDVLALHKAISGILHTGKGQYSSLCRQRAEMKFNKDERFQDYIELYNSLL